MAKDAPTSIKDTVTASAQLQKVFFWNDPEFVISCNKTHFSVSSEFSVHLLREQSPRCVL